MKIFKKAIAILVVYIMATMMLPIGNLKSYATESIPQYLTINDIYIRSISQYQNKASVLKSKE